MRAAFRLLTVATAGALLSAIPVGAQSAVVAVPSNAKPAASAKPAVGKRPPAHVPDTLASIRASGKLKVCVALLAPWVMNAPTEGLRGFSIDVIRQLAEDLDVEPEYVQTDFGDLIPSLDDGDCHVVISGLWATPARALFANFTAPVRIHEMRLTPAARRSDWKKTSDFDRPDVTIGALEGSPSLLLGQKVFPKAKIQAFGGESELQTAMIDDEIDALVATSPMGELFAKASEKIGTPLEPPLGSGAEAFAVRRGDPDFLDYLNTWIQARSFDGFFKERGDYWFKKLEWESKGEIKR